MFDIGILLKRAGTVAAKNSPAILTAIGVTGTLSTAYLAARAAFKSVDVLKEAEETKREAHYTDSETVEKEYEGLTTQDKFEATWKLYGPAVASAGITITAIIFANRIQDRRSAALASAYTVVKESYTEYRAKNLEKLGKKKEQDLRDEIAQDRLNRNPVDKSVMIYTDKGHTWCYDMWTDRYFLGDLESLRKAMNDFNQMVINQTYASLTDFYQMIGLPSTRMSDDVGWDTDKLMELSFTGTIREDGTPCIAMDFLNPPNPRFAELYR